MFYHFFGLDKGNGGGIGTLQGQAVWNCDYLYI